MPERSPYRMILCRRETTFWGEAVAVLLNGRLQSDVDHRRRITIEWHPFPSMLRCYMAYPSCCVRECSVVSTFCCRAARVRSTNGTPEPASGIDDVESVDCIRVTVAESVTELTQARELVRRRYSWRGYEIEALSAASKASATSAIDPNEVTFVAHADDSVLGTLTLRLDGPQGLMAEKTHHGVIDRRRAEGGRVCELTRLAVVENPHSKLILASLFGITHALALTVHQITDAFIEVNPRHVRFYSRILGFVAAAGERFCERVQAPSVLLRLELKEQLQMFGIEPSFLEPLFAKEA